MGHRSFAPLEKARVFRMTNWIMVLRVMNHFSVRWGSEPNARLLCRKERDTSRGSPRSFTAQRTLVQDDNQTTTTQHRA